MLVGTETRWQSDIYTSTEKMAVKKIFGSQMTAEIGKEKLLVTAITAMAVLKGLFNLNQQRRIFNRTVR